MVRKNSKPADKTETAEQQSENHPETVETAEAPIAEQSDSKAKAKPEKTDDAENGHPELPPKEAAAVFEALLFSSEDAVPASRIRDAVPGLKSANLGKLAKNLNKAYEKGGRSFRIESVAGGFQLFTAPEYSDYIEKFYAKRQQNRLSKKALETLAIVAYKQPVTRTDIEEIRGVNADGVVRTLLMRGLITITGTAPTPGNPYLYKTTRTFLEYFGLKNIKDLPRLKELDELVEADSELQEKIDLTVLKEIAPESLGLDKAKDGNESEESNSESETESGNGSETEQQGTADSGDGEKSGESNGGQTAEDQKDNESGDKAE